MRSVAVLGLAVGLVAAVGRPPLWGQTHPKGADGERVARLVRQLGDSQFRQREAAGRELDAIGEPALTALRTAAASDSDPEVRQRAGGLVRTIVSRLAAAEQKRLDGKWVGVTDEQNGNEARSGARVVLADGRSVATDPAGAEIFRCTWRVVDPTAMPRQLDLHTPDGQVFRAIYEFDGTKLRYCGSYTERPDRFGTRPGDGRYMATLKREPK